MVDLATAHGLIALGHEVLGLEGTSMFLNIPANLVHIQHNRFVSEWGQIDNFILAEMVEIKKDEEVHQGVLVESVNSP